MTTRAVDQAERAEMIICEYLGGEVPTVWDGELWPIEEENLTLEDVYGKTSAEAYETPANCPRKPNFDPEQPLGCLACNYARIPEPSIPSFGAGRVTTIGSITRIPRPI